MAATTADKLTAADTDATLMRTDTLKKKLGTADLDVTPADFTRSMVQTFFYTGLGKGDEIADYSIAFNTDNSQTKSYTKNYYDVSGTATTADKLTAADTDATLMRTDTLKKKLGTADLDVTPADFTRSMVQRFFFPGLGRGDKSGTG